MTPPLAGRASSRSVPAPAEKWLGTCQSCPASAQRSCARRSAVPRPMLRRAHPTQGAEPAREVQRVAEPGAAGHFGDRVGRHLQESGRQLAATGLLILDADIDPAQLATYYARAGAVHLRGVLTPEEVTELREAFTSHIETDGSGGAFHEIPEGDPLHAYPRMIQPHRDEHGPGRLSRRWLLEQR